MSSESKEDKQNPSNEGLDAKIAAGNKTSDRKIRKKKKGKKNIRSDEQKEPFASGGDKESNVVGAKEHAGELDSVARHRENDHNLKKSSREAQKLSKKKKKSIQARASSITSNEHPNKRNSYGSLKDDDSDCGEDTNNGEEDFILEGSMVSDIFVLIDRKAGRVYSATDRLQNGDRRQIGSLNEKGEVVLSPRTEEAESVESASPLKVHNGNGDDSGDDFSSAFPYEVDPDDHCESPLEAYEDVIPLLQSYGKWIRKQSNSQLSIYDPYFCNGRVARHLESLGFPEVYNRKENCYEVWKDPSLYPSYDVFLTNPPYSADHIEKLMQHVTSKQNKNKPWMLLMPNFVHKKDYYQRLTVDSGQLPIYLVPKKRYVYQPPPNMRAKKASSTHKKSSPFVSMWYLWGGNRDVTDEWYRLLRKRQSTTFGVARSKSALRDLRRKPKKR